MWNPNRIYWRFSWIFAIALVKKCAVLHLNMKLESSSTNCYQFARLAMEIFQGNALQNSFERLMTSRDPNTSRFLGDVTCRLFAKHLHRNWKKLSKFIWLASINFIWLASINHVRERSMDVERLPGSFRLVPPVVSRWRWRSLGGKFVLEKFWLKFHELDLVSIDFYKIVASVSWNVEHVIGLVIWRSRDSV